MLDTDNLVLPSVLQGITTTTEALEFTMANEMQLGSLLRSLAASMLGSKVLQLGAGSGVLTAWLLDGMAGGSSLLSIETDAELARVVERFLGRDRRLQLSTASPATRLGELAAAGEQFGLIVVTRPAALEGLLEQVLAILPAGGLLVVAGLGENAEHGDGEREAARKLASHLQERPDLHLAIMDWSSGVVLAARAGARTSDRS